MKIKTKQQPSHKARLQELTACGSRLSATHKRTVPQAGLRGSPQHHPNLSEMYAEGVSVGTAAFATAGGGFCHINLKHFID